MYAQEVLGVVYSSQKCVFDKEWLADFEERAPRPLPVTSTKGCFITTMIDPAGSGDSYTAICSVVRVPDTPHIFIVGMGEADPQSVVDFQAMIQAYFANLYSHDFLSKLDHVVCVESNYGGPLLANSIFEICCQHAPTRLYEYRTHVDSGVITDNNNKTASCMSAIWDMSRGHIEFHDPLISLSMQEADTRAVKTQFFTQCSNFHKKFKSSGKWSYTGKGKPGARDDMLISYLLGSYFSKVIATKQQSRNAWLSAVHNVSANAQLGKKQKLQMEFMRH